jgi:hypothetical protein
MQWRHSTVNPTPGRDGCELWKTTKAIVLRILDFLVWFANFPKAPMEKRSSMLCGSGTLLVSSGNGGRFKRQRPDASRQTANHVSHLPARLHDWTQNVFPARARFRRSPNFRPTKNRRFRFTEQAANRKTRILWFGARPATDI